MMSFGDCQFLYYFLENRRFTEEVVRSVLKVTLAISCRSWEQLQQTADRTQSRTGIWTNVYSVLQEERAVFLEVIVLLIVKKCHMNMCLMWMVIKKKKLFCC